MGVVGLIVEYNPFHNGHSYHLNMAKELSGADEVICVMSGNFIQRGEPAIFDKWARAKMAIMGGADLIIELPVVYAMASAEFFASAAVALLNSTGVVDSICFGSESGTLEELHEIADILANEPDKYKELLKKYLDTGISFPSARQKAISEYMENEGLHGKNIQDIISKSNNILGVEYLKALKRLKSDIKPFTLKRQGNNYTDKNLTGSFSSATSIRELIKNNGIHNDLQNILPKSTLSVIEEEIASGRGPIFTEFYDGIVLALLRSFGKTGLEYLPYMGEGLHNRLYKGLSESSTIEQLVDKICTKRYTRTRVLRGIMHTLTGLKEDEVKQFETLGGPSYIRILALNDKGRQILARMKKRASLPILIKPADYTKLLDESGQRMFEIEAASTDMYVLGYPNSLKGIGQEFTRNVVRMGL